MALSDVRRAARAAARAPYVLIIACALAATVELAVSALVGRSFGKGGTAAELASFFSTLTVLVAITAVLGDRWMRRRPGR